MHLSVMLELYSTKHLLKEFFSNYSKLRITLPSTIKEFIFFPLLFYLNYRSKLLSQLIVYSTIQEQIERTTVKNRPFQFSFLHKYIWNFKLVNYQKINLKNDPFIKINKLTNKIKYKN